MSYLLHGQYLPNEYRLPPHPYPPHHQINHPSLSHSETFIYNDQQRVAELAELDRKRQLDADFRAQEDAAWAAEEFLETTTGWASLNGDLPVPLPDDHPANNYPTPVQSPPDAERALELALKGIAGDHPECYHVPTGHDWVAQDRGVMSGPPITHERKRWVDGFIPPQNSLSGPLNVSPPRNPANQFCWNQSYELPPYPTDPLNPNLADPRSHYLQTDAFEHPRPAPRPPVVRENRKEMGTQTRSPGENGNLQRDGNGRKSVNAGQQPEEWETLLQWDDEDDQNESEDADDEREEDAEYDTASDSELSEWIKI